ncbi:hypothetical protein [Janibacter sp. GXQ6167]|uniref:hypothetical protein n=1 Tax=Janibacter sp. GXQ6167 TaxID=3240791 RepID=UPI0035238829
MSFHDLPSDWPTRALSDTAVAADVVDLVMRESDRINHAVCAIFCRPDLTMLQPMAGAGFFRDTPPHACRSFFDLALGELGLPVGAVVLGLGRPHGTVPTDAERTWHQGAIEFCRDQGVPLLAAYLVTCDGVTELPRHDVAA